jgi:hypothetical protein
MASPDPDISFDAPISDTETIDRTGTCSNESTPTQNFKSTDDRRHVQIRDNSDSRHVQFRDSTHYMDRTNNSQQNTQFIQGAYSPHSTSRSNQSVTIKPDTYDGSSGFEQYLSHFQDCAELSLWDARTRV